MVIIMYLSDNTLLLLFNIYLGQHIAVYLPLNFFEFFFA